MAGKSSRSAEAQLAAALSQPAIHYRTNVLIERAADLVKHREAKVLERIAGYMDRVIQRQAKVEGEKNEFARLYYSDVDLWLRSGAQDRKPPPHSGVPPDIARSEYLATMAVWKGGQLGKFTASHLVAQIDRTELPRDSEEVLHRLLMDSFYSEPLVLEIAQAAMLALEASYFEGEIAKAHEAGAREAERALKHAQDMHVRTAGRLGGLAKGSKYDPARQEAIRLYEAGAGKGNRAAAVREIVAVLEARGLHSKYEFVMTTLKKHDKSRRDAQLEAAARAAVDAKIAGRVQRPSGL